MLAGAAYLELDGYETLVHDCNFAQNTAGNDTQSGTGVIYIGKSGLVYAGQSVSSVLYMLNTIFSGNSGTSSGVVLLDTLQCALLSNNSFEGNQGSTAAAVVIQGASADPQTCAAGVANSTFAASVDLTPQAFDPFTPGALVNNASSSTQTFFNPYNIDIRHMTFEDNVGSGAGGMYLLENEQDVAVTNSSFHNNSASQGYGGAIHMQGTSSLALQSCTFGSNFAISGGAVFFQSITSGTVVSDCTSNNNSASYSGGAVSMWTGSLNVTSSAFNNNSGGTFGGGAIICRDCIQVVFSSLAAWVNLYSKPQSI